MIQDDRPKEWNVFKVGPFALKQFVDRSNEIGGNRIERIDKHNNGPIEYYLVVISRTEPYPFIINELKKLAE